MTAGSPTEVGRVARRLEREAARRLEAEGIAEQATARLFSANEELAHVVAELDAVNEELRNLLYTVSHDLKNPVVTLLGYLDLWAEDLDELDVEHAQDLDAMRRSARYMGSLIEDLLAVSRIGRERDPDRGRVDLSTVASEVAEELGRSHPDVNVDVVELPTVLGDPVRLRQLLENLMRNAVAHGGREDVTVRIVGRADGDAFHIDVADDGVGVPAGQRDAIFRMFDRGDKPRSADSTGIGLAICRKVVQQMDGTLTIPASPDGATFRITLPARLIVD